MGKNIVLVTWKGGGNFGTCLQSYALYQKLQYLGYSVSFLTRRPKEYTLKLYVKYILICLGVKWIKNKLKKDTRSLQEKKREKFQNDIFRNIQLYTRHQEERLVENTDCFVTGSDQIWNTYYNFNPFFFLDFAGDKKRVAYASSIGTDSVNEEYKDAVRGLLMKFSHIGVRECEAVKVLSELTGRKDIIQVLDPTFLLTPVDWQEMSKQAVFEIEIPKKYILCYLIGQNDWYKEQLLDVRSRLGIEDVVIIPAAENPEFAITDFIVYKDASPVEFIWLIQHASYVCTDSFHASALSINHSIPFVEFMRFKDTDEKSQNSRIYDLLSHYGLMNRIYNQNSDAWCKPIDYLTVQNVLAQDRKNSLNYLVNSIEN